MTGTSPIGMAVPAPRPGSADRIRAFASRYAILLFLAAVVVAGGLAAPGFLSGSNLTNMLMQFVPLGIVVIGQTFVILVRGLDLSVASVMATAAVAATAFGGVNADAPAVFATAIGIGAAVGLVNGLLVTKRNVSPFLATLATMIVLQGIRFAWTQGAPSGNVPPIFRTIGAGTFNGIPYNVLFLLVVAAAGAAALHLSGFGRRLYITGGNPLTAHLVGIRAARVTLAAYVVSGVLAAIAGLVLAGFVGVVDNFVGRGFELDSIVAAVVGGVALSGGKGTIAGALTGAAILVAISNLVVMLGLPVQAQIILKGIVIIVAASFYVARRR
ncbi:ABC transporter permease [Antarcticirhabdus aurantiaca]|uniref:ABC transporter permease n=1 Tax=Antarcticirhabdus aurantiaca TaxID=2606717 RepID=A0ACD4NQ08_9HYPH|nr:ABC transporter permease [Antarcticirhabdus aurantiaca]WAJ28874.1 ABC transporter permease [Jeongeuplla avenae]